MCVAVMPLVLAVFTGGDDPLTTSYQDADNIEGPLVDLAAFPVRPMLIPDDGGDLWTINHADSTVERFRFTGTLAQTPHAVYDVPWKPVAIAHWKGPDSDSALDDEILVLCGGSWTLVALGRKDGGITRLFQLRPDSGNGNPDMAAVGKMAEPGDLLVNGNSVFVSCAGADSVLQIGLFDFELEELFNEERFPSFQVKRPLFLSLDVPPPTGGPRRVLVAPLLSGNNSTADGPQNITAANAVVLDLADPDWAVPPGLPDTDLFRLTPASPVTAPAVEPVARATGTLLFAQGLNPVTHDFWQLNTEANNKDRALQSEPLVKGIFAFSRVTILEDIETPVVEPGANDIKSLDSVEIPGGPLPPGRGVGQPFALAFNSLGQAFITGLLSDNVTVLGPDGQHLGEWDVEAPSRDGVHGRAIPRGILIRSTLDANRGRVLVYCWGDNSIREYAYDLAQPRSETLVSTYYLRHDPTPANVRSGRAHFFDGSNSKSGTLSCASCHVEGGSDFLTWNLSNLPQDDKGPMVTQTLVGLERLGPFHWRGERQLTDFNPAFSGLLGGRELNPDEFQDFEAFLFSLANPANPNQNRERILDPDIHGPRTNGNAVLGQQHWRTELTFLSKFRCNTCHAQPTGTNNDIHVDAPSIRRPSRAHFKPTPLHETWRKDQSLVTVDLLDGNGQPLLDNQGLPVSRSMGFLGSGISHAGLFEDLFAFVAAAQTNDDLPASVTDDITDFVHQWDQGLAPAVHFAFLLNAASHAAGTQELAYLQSQADQRNCDIAVMGTVLENGALMRTRWFFDRQSGAYRSENPAIDDRSIDSFLQATLDSGSPESNVFIGLPVGKALRFAVDHDMDGLFNADPMEASPYKADPPDLGDTTPPSFSSGPEIDWRTTRLARLRFETDEPSTARVEYLETGTLVPRIVESPALAREHTLLLTGLRPSTMTPGGVGGTLFADELVSYQFELHVTDRAGNSPALPTKGSFDSEPFIEPDPSGFDPTGDDRLMHEEHVLRPWVTSAVFDTNSGTAEMRAGAQITFKRGPGGSVPAPDRIVIGRALKAACDPQGRAGCGPTELVPETQVTPLTFTAVFDEIWIYSGLHPNQGGNIANMVRLEAPGPFLVSTVASGATGATGVMFSVTGLSSGDRVLFDVDSVLQVLSQAQYQLDVSNALTLPDGTRQLFVEVLHSRSFTQWAFPDTTEALMATSVTFP